MFKPLLTTLILSVSLPLSAQTLSLVDSCVELVNIYESKNQVKVFAAQTTSLSESLRAGYCLGVLQEYSQNQYCRKDWFKKAEFIAKFQTQTDMISERQLLKMTCK